MLRGTCVRHAAWCVGGLRAVLRHWASGGLRLPQDKAPLTVARCVILYGPEPHCQGSGSFVSWGGGGSQEWAVALLGVHTPPKYPPLSVDTSIRRLLAAEVDDGVVGASPLLLASPSVLSE